MIKLELWIASFSEPVSMLDSLSMDSKELEDLPLDPHSLETLEKEIYNYQWPFHLQNEMRRMKE